MDAVLNEILAANARYAESFGGRGELAANPARGIAILTCMDARFDPARAAGLREGDAHVIRNAGGRASDDALRSLIFSYKLLGTSAWFIIHHTACGLLSVDGETMSALLASSLKPARFEDGVWKDPGGGGSPEGQFIHWLTFKEQDKALLDDVLRIRHHPLVPKEIPIYGLIFDVKTGRLRESKEATEAGAARS